jgi:hypothetical protein
MVRTNEVSIAMLSIVLFYFFTWMTSIRIVRFFFVVVVLRARTIYFLV